MKTRAFGLAPLVFLLAGCGCFGREIDRRCLQGDCVVLNIEGRQVVARRTGEFSGKRTVGTIAPDGRPFLPPTEAPLRFANSPGGWRVILAAFLPQDFDYNAPELRLRILDPRNGRQTVVDDYNVLGSFHIGPIFETGNEFLQVSTSGPHAYITRTRVWLLPPDGSPNLLLDVPGTLIRIQTQTGAQPAGLWIDRETYDGVHAETKGRKREFWRWDASNKTLGP